MKPVAASVAGTVALLGLAACSPPEPVREHPQRIILIVADTLRRDFLSPYGSRRATPNVARLAESGQVFTNAVASFHQTAMSMSAMFTGRTPSIEVGEQLGTLPRSSETWCGMARFATKEDKACIPAHLETLAEDLHDAGYETLGVVSNALLFRPLGYEQGFDTWEEVGAKGRRKAQMPSTKVKLLRSGKQVNKATFRVLAGRKTDRFFLYVHFLDPHDYEIRPALKGYASAVRYFDFELGVLLDHLEEERLLEDALVIFTADHGEYLGEEHPLLPGRGHFGNPSYGSVLRIPFIVVPPTQLDSARLIRSQDMRGLVRELVGLPGLPAADIGSDEVLLSETYYQTYRRGRWKSMYSRHQGTTVLYDIERNPAETRDVAALQPEVVAEHRERVNELTRQLGRSNAADAKLSADYADRLRALGYLE
jgi:arylsulfatase A-like enzyme